MCHTHVCQREALKKKVQSARRQVSGGGEMSEVLASDVSLDAAVYLFVKFFYVFSNWSQPVDRYECVKFDLSLSLDGRVF